MPRSVKVVVYQLVVRYFGNINTTNQVNGSIDVNGCGRFNDINTPALTSLKQLGVTHIWLTGCLRQATLTDYTSYGLPPDDPDNVKGIAGSFYAVRDYFDVCPDLATDPADRLAEFDALVDRIHTAGMKALIDFVPNHVARGYNSVVKPDLNFGVDDDTTRFFHRDNHFFYLVDPPGQKLSLSKPDSWTPPDGFEFDGEFALEDGSPGRPPKATGNNVTRPNPSVGDWYETVKLNYGYNFTTQAGDYSPRPRTWNTADQILAYWQALGVDGFRCDFAHYLPAEAWSYLIGQSRLRDSEAFFFAEAYPFDGSGDPITEMRQLIRAGFDAVYNDASYDRLKLVYQGRNGLDHYDQAMVNVPLDDRVHSVEYLENHDERRIASPVTDGGPDDSGFGTAEAGYQLAPLQFLAGAGPLLLLNGQEVGEAGAGAEGFGGDDGRTTIFDYWCMPELAKWVNGHAFDGGLLTAAQKSLRNFYADLLALCQDRAVRADGHWGLKYFNRPENFSDCPAELYSFVRYESGSGRMLVIAANFRPNSDVECPLRIPMELADAVSLADNLTVYLRLDREGAKQVSLGDVARQHLNDEGFQVSIPNQTAHVYEIRATG